MMQGLSGGKEFKSTTATSRTPQKTPKATGGTSASGRKNRDKKDGTSFNFFISVFLYWHAEYTDFFVQSGI